MGELVEQAQQLLRHAPQVGLFEPLLFAQMPVQQGAAPAVGNDGRVERNGLRPVVERHHPRQ